MRLRRDADRSRDFERNQSLRRRPVRQDPGAGTPTAGVSCYANIGNADFAATCIRAKSTIGFMWLGAGTLSRGFLLDGAELWIDPAKPGVLLPAFSDASGLARVRLPISNNTRLIGLQLHAQFLFHQRGCRVPIFASEGLTITLQK